MLRSDFRRAPTSCSKESGWDSHLAGQAGTVSRWVGAALCHIDLGCGHLLLLQERNHEDDGHVSHRLPSDATALPTSRLVTAPSRRAALMLHSSRKSSGKSHLSFSFMV